MYYVIESKNYSDHYLASDGDGNLKMQNQLQHPSYGFDYSSPAILFFLEMPSKPCVLSSQFKEKMKNVHVAL